MNNSSQKVSINILVQMKIDFLEIILHVMIIQSGLLIFSKCLMNKYLKAIGI